MFSVASFRGTIDGGVQLASHNAPFLEWVLDNGCPGFDDIVIGLGKYRGMLQPGYKY